MNKRLRKTLTPQGVALVLVVFGLLVGLVGFINHYFLITYGGNGSILGEIIEELYANILVDFLGLGLTVLVIDKLYERINEQRELQDLINEFQSAVNAVAIRASEELRRIGCLADGTLRNRNFFYADLSNGELYGSDLSGADFSNAKLSNANFNMTNLTNARFHSAKLNDIHFCTADLTNAQFSFSDFAAADLQDANLSDASFLGVNFSNVKNLAVQQLALTKNLYRSFLPGIGYYDGRFRLASDLESEGMGFDINNPNQMAEYFGVPVENYIAGQQWADEHLEVVLSEARILTAVSKERREEFLRAEKQRLATPSG